MQTVLAVLFLSAISCARAENKCECAAFMKGYMQDTDMIYNQPISGTEDPKLFKELCLENLKKTTGDGDLNYHLTETETVGSYVCAKFGKDITDGEVGGYSRCQGSWEEVMKAKEPICCKTGKLC